MAKKPRLEKVREYIGVNKKEFATKLEITQNSYTNYINNKRTIPTELAIKIKQMYDINLDWLLTGIGEMIATGNTVKDGYEIEVLSVHASAGHGITNYVVEAVDTIILDKSLFKTPQDQDKMKLIRVSGDSMFPTLNDGDFVIIDVRTFAEYNQSHIKDSINIPYDIIEYQIENYIKDKNQKIIIYCRSWNRSAIATWKLIYMWYTDVNDLWAFDNWEWEVE